LEVYYKVMIQIN